MSTPQRLPFVNGDDGQWGDILVQWLKKEHYDDGTDNAVNGGHKTVTLRAGTATAGTAPLKFTSGTLLTAPEAGSIEFLTDQLYFTGTTGPTRKTVATYDDSSGATGDIHYRASSGAFTRLGIGSSGNVLSVSSGLPAWGTLANATGLPISSGVSGLGTGIATFLGTPSSANLLAALTTSTGTGVSTFATAPTFTTNITAPLIYGGSSGTSTLTLQADSGALSNARILINDQITMLAGNRTFTASTGHIINIADTYTLDFATPSFGQVFGFNATVILKQSAGSGMGTLFNNSATFKNDSSVAANLANLFSFTAQPIIQSDSQTITQASQWDFMSRTGFRRATSGSLTTTDWTQFLAGDSVINVLGSIGANTTVTTRTAFRVTDVTGAGTLTNQYGLDIAALAKGVTNNIGVRIAIPSGATNNYALQLSDTGGTAAGGITFGTDSQLYRSGTSILTSTAQFNAVTGTTTLAPIQYTSGTNLTTAVAGAREFDGTQHYGTIDTTSGRGAIPTEQYFRLAADGSTISTIANFFGATSNISLVANAYYEIEIFCWFLNTTAGTVTWTFTNSAAPTNQNIHYRYSPVGGVDTAAGVATYLEGDIVKDATATKALTVSGTLTTAVNHYAHFKIHLRNGTGTSLKIQATKAVGGTITPLYGSYYKARRLPASSTGTFAA